MGSTPKINSTQESGEDSAGIIARLGMRLADECQKWFPDAFVFALGGLLVVFLAGVFSGVGTQNLIKYFGDGFWGLIPFTMQMAMIIIGGYVVATSPPVHRLIQKLAKVPRTPRGAVAFVAFFSMTMSLLSWGLGLIFGGVLAREVVRNVRGIDYRSIGVAAYLGNGSVWALGLSSSAAMVMATPGSMPSALLKISGVIPLSRTIYTWQSGVTAAALMLSCITLAYLSTPAHSGKDAESFGVTEGLGLQKIEERKTPAEWLDSAPVFSVVVGILGLAYLYQVLAAKGPLAALDLNTYNLLFLMVGLLLHWRPRSFVRAVNEAVPATAGVLIQFPFYGGIFGMITYSAISATLAHFFVSISSTNSFPILVSIYSAFLGMFVPSGGSKWIIEAPYVLQAAKDLHVNLGWVVQIYNTSEALPNLINPFWMLPLLGLLKVKARDLIGYGLLYFTANFVLVLFLMWLLARTFAYVPPVLP
ncbi:MAG TPA: TIGR00366 family protein [Candidatus Acidoferrales bacterium]|nr:TIGR00366 family protein [Candidatus Acidoferrales bacterium]